MIIIMMKNNNNNNNNNNNENNNGHEMDKNRHENETINCNVDSDHSGTLNVWQWLE